MVRIDDITEKLNHHDERSKTLKINQQLRGRMEENDLRGKGNLVSTEVNNNYSVMIRKKLLSIPDYQQQYFRSKTKRSIIDLVAESKTLMQQDQVPAILKWDK